VSAGLNALLFHRISDGVEMPSDVDRALFWRCLALLQAAGTPVRSLAECRAATIPPRTEILCLTFDDGWESDVTVSLPALAGLGVRGTFFVTTGTIGTPGFLSWPQVKMLADAGMELGSHTCSHPHLTRLAPDDLRRELRDSRQALEDRLGRRVDSLSVPHGSYNRRVLEAATTAGYEWVCVSRPGLNALPLRRGRPIRRNAFHRAIGDADLARIIHPGRATVLGWQVSYLGRAALRRMVSERRYAALRTAVTARRARRRVNR